MFTLFLSVICGLVLGSLLGKLVGNLLFSTRNKKPSYKQVFNSNSQISIQSGNSCSTSNINGHVEIRGDIKSLKINGKQVEL